MKREKDELEARKANGEVVDEKEEEKMRQDEEDEMREDFVAVAERLNLETADELNDYFKHPFEGHAALKQQTGTLQSWWDDFGSQFGTLRRIAKMLAAGVACSGNSERAHKSMRDIHTDARNRLDGVNVEKLTYIHFNGLQFKLTRTEEKKVQLGLDDAKDAKDAKDA